MCVYILIILLLAGCSDSASSDKDIAPIEIPKENKIELVEKWANQLDSPLMQCVVENNLVYIITEEMCIYVINLDDGEVLHSFKLDINKHNSSSISIYDGLLAIGFSSNKIIVVDTDSEKIKRVIRGHIYNVCIYKDILMYWDFPSESIIAININTSEEIWRVGGNRAEHGMIDLFTFEDKYFMWGKKPFFIQYDPKTGQGIKKYAYEEKGWFKDGNIDHLYEKITTPMDDSKLENIFNRKLLGLLKTTTPVDISFMYGDTLYFYGKDTQLDWEIKFPFEERIDIEWRDYIFIAAEKDKVLLFDLTNKEVLWSKDYTISRRPYMFIYEDMFVFPGVDGTLRAYDLSPLKKNE